MAADGPGAVRFSHPVTVTLYEQGSHGGKCMPKNLFAAIAWLQKYLDRVPAEYCNKATIKIDADTIWDEPYVVIKISYERPPTQAERQERLDSERQGIEEREADERRTYDRLRGKYEN